MSRYYVFGALSGIACGLIAFLIIRAVRGKPRKQFDERQIVARGKAFQHAFLTLVIYLGAYATLCAICERALMEPTLEGLIGIFLSLTVFAVYCVWHDAFFQIGQNGKSYLIFCAVFVLAAGLGAVRHLNAGDLIENGMLTFEALMPVEALAFLAIGAAVLLKMRRDGREDAE